MLRTFSGRTISPEASHVLRETHNARLAGELGPDRYDAIIARHVQQTSLKAWGVTA